MSLTLAGRVAVVTGGTRGIGHAIAEAFANEGMRVAVIGKTFDRAKQVEEHFKTEGLNVVGFGCDVSRVESIPETLRNISDQYGAIDVLVNCAGILDTSTVESLSEREWDAVLGTNLKGAYFMTQQAIAYLKNSEAPRVINISSNAGRMGGFENGLAYTASKGGMISLTYGFARRLAPQGITVNCIAPGTIDSDMSSEFEGEARERLLARFPLRRFGTPKEVAAAACYFASIESGFTTGAVLDVNGGMFMG